MMPPAPARVASRASGWCIYGSSGANLPDFVMPPAPATLPPALAGANRAAPLVWGALEKMLLEALATLAEARCNEEPAEAG
jgi:hypothetical protein